MKHRALAIAMALTTATALFSAEERIDIDVNAKIREEGLNNSRIMDTVHVLTDVHGPRLTGSPSLKAAGEWAIREMESWGLTNGRMEPWDFGRPGWTNDFAWGAMISPVKDNLEFEVVAWTPGTDGAISGPAVSLVLPERPTQEELTTYFASVREKVNGAMVLVGRPRVVGVDFDPPAKRRSDEQVRALFDPAQPVQGRRGRGGRGGRAGRALPAGVLPSSEVATRLDEFLLSAGAGLRINDAARAHGQIVAFGSRTNDPARTVPTVVMRNEDFGRIVRILERGTPVELRFHIVNSTFPEGKTAYNAIAEIPGSDMRDEVVMLGGHLDSWHVATGATDNAIGCAVMMEAARIVKVVSVRPRRTIRVALWSGEEQGLLGSQAYVAQHFGTSEDPKPGHGKLVAYMNLDTGTGRIRGAGVFGPPEAAQALREILKPFEDFGVFGASATSSRFLGGTDHTSFNKAGLPGINFTQDPVEYNTHTHHTNLDTYERIVEQDVKQSAVVIASLLYHLSVREDPLPRFDAASMPPPR